MLGRTLVRLAATPSGGIRQMSAETMPIRFVPEMLKLYRADWYNKSEPFYKPRRFTSVEDTWPNSQVDRRSPTGSDPVLHATYSRDALMEAQKMIPDWFQTADVPRPPQRIKAVSEGIVGRWYTNYWTLSSVKYQCVLANVPWKHGERMRAVSNFDEPYYYVDWEETKAIRDHRSKWINIHRSMVGMTKKIKEAEEENRFKAFKKNQDQFWSDRRVFFNRIRAMRTAGEEVPLEDLPIKTINFAAFDM